ncbi:MAG: HAMP domain-containing histidine kinase [Anaerolineae bacterium]|nr:HAMP domain-containing histidine kinase [Anaerolineae bacterium]
MNRWVTWLTDNRSGVLEIFESHLDGQAHALALWAVLISDAEEVPPQASQDFVRQHLLLVHSSLPAAAALLLTIQTQLNLHIRATLSAEAALDVLERCQADFSQMILHLMQPAALPSGDEQARLQRHKSDFIAIAAHELKTPLTLIEGYTNMLEAQLSGEDNLRAALMLNGITSGARRLREIIEDMIDISLIEMQLLKLHRQPVWIKRLLNIVVAELQPVAAERKLSLVFDSATCPEVVTLGDPERLLQLFGKLLENAIKYTPDEGQILLTARSHEGMLEICIQDSGIGINQEDLPMIFDKFVALSEVNLHSSSKTQFKGSGPGLGLAIARGIVEAHAGKIWAESEARNEETFPGTRFYVHLPIHQEAVQTLLKDPAQGKQTWPPRHHPALSHPLNLQPEESSPSS